MIDTYTKTVLTVIALALVAIVLRPITTAQAELPVPDVKVGRPSASRPIPRNWGRFVGATGADTQLWFEAADGTIRRSGCPACEYVRSN